jgi:serine/threonine protein kinase
MNTQTDLPIQFGRYQILQKLGQGGMGAVYLAEDSKLGRRVALKVPRFAPEDGSRVIDRFSREARVAAGIDHPNICPVYDVGEVEGVHYFTMPFIEGMPLSEQADPDRLLPPPDVAILIRRLALAVAVLHERGIIHRDLKPSNIFLRPNGEPVVMDFGLARSVSGTGRLTATGAALGTPAYMSPEQVRGQLGELGPATDIYSLGVILFELLTGHLPFVGPFEAVCSQILFGAPPNPSQLRVEVDARLDAICQKAMGKRAEDRYASMGDFAAALEGYALTMRAAAPGAKKPAAHEPSAPRPSDAAARAIPPSQAKSPPVTIEPLPEVASKITCPSCQKICKVPQRALGKRLRCPLCGSAFQAPTPTKLPPDAQKPAGAETRGAAEAQLATEVEQPEGGPAAYPVQGIKKPPGRRPSKDTGSDASLGGPEAQQLRQVVLLDRLRQLLALHRRPSVRTCVWAFVLGVPLGLIGGGCITELVAELTAYRVDSGSTYSYTVSNFSAGLLIGIPAGIALFATLPWLFLLVLPRRRVRLREDLIASIEKEYPQEVRSWGGPSVLNESAGVRELVRILNKK